MKQTAATSRKASALAVLRRFLLLLVLGLLINGLVVGLLSVTVNPHFGGSIGATGPGAIGHQTVNVQQAVGTFAMTREHAQAFRGQTGTTPASLTPGWIPDLERPDIDFENIFEQHEARGWPLPSFRCRTVLVVRPIGGAAPTVEPLRGGIELPLQWDSAGRQRPRFLPVRPIWPGLVINTVFWAAVAALLLAVAQRLRAARRFERGRCPRCGYVLHHDYRRACPECGRNPTGATESMGGT